MSHIKLTLYTLNQHTHVKAIGNGANTIKYRAALDASKTQHQAMDSTAHGTIQARVDCWRTLPCSVWDNVCNEAKQSKAKSLFVRFDRLLSVEEWRPWQWLSTEVGKYYVFLTRKNEENAKTCLLKFGKCKKCHITEWCTQHTTVIDTSLSLPTASASV